MLRDRIKDIKEVIEDWYVLNIREFYMCWIKDFWQRAKIPRNLPFTAYKQMIFDISPLGINPEGYMDKIHSKSLKRYCEKGIKKMRLESKFN